MTDLEVPCFEGEHLFTVWVAVALLGLYIFAVPGMIAWITKHHRDRLYTKGYLMKYGFLYNGYERGREWWEVIVLARKTVLAIVIVYFKDPFIQSFAAVFVLTMALYVQLEFKPYKQSVLNRVEELGLTTALFTQMLCLAYFWIDNGMTEDEDSLRWKANVVTVTLLWINLDAACMFLVYVWTVSKRHVIAVFKRLKSLCCLCFCRKPLVLPDTRESRRVHQGKRVHRGFSLHLLRLTSTDQLEATQAQDCIDAQALSTAKVDRLKNYVPDKDFELLGSLYKKLTEDHEELKASRARLQSKQGGMPFPGLEILTIIARGIQHKWQAYHRAKNAASDDAAAALGAKKKKSKFAAMKNAGKLDNPVDSVFDAMQKIAAAHKSSAAARKEGRRPETAAAAVAAAAQVPAATSTSKPKAAPSIRRRKSIKKAFSQIDKGNTGAVGFDQFLAVCESDDTATARKLFDLIAGKAGAAKITKAAFTDAMRHNEEAAALAEQFHGLRTLFNDASVGDELKSAITVLDADGNGLLDRAEFAEACHAGAGDPDVARLFDLLDEDHSGSVECGELAHALRTNPEAMALARRYEPLQEIVRLSAVRKSKSSKDGGSGKKSSRKHRHRRGTARHLHAAVDAAGAFGGGAKPHGHGHSSSRRHHHHARRSLRSAADAVKVAHRAGGGGGDSPSISSHSHGGGRLSVQQVYHVLDENGDGTLDFEEFRHACKASPDDAECKKLFDLLDEDGGGSLECKEIVHALRTNAAAKELAQHYDALHDLVRVSANRRRRRSSVGRNQSRRERAHDARQRRRSSGGLHRKNTLNVAAQMAVTMRRSATKKTKISKAAGPPQENFDMTKHPRIRDFIRAHCDTGNLRALFAEVDVDGDLEVSLAEFTAFVEGIVARADGSGDAAGGITPQEIEDTFNFIDRDKSGGLSRDEFEQYMAMFEGQVNVLDV